MLQNKETFERFSILILGTSVASLTGLGVPVASGVLEAMAAGSMLWFSASGRHASNLTAKSFEQTVKKEWKNWGKLNSIRDASEKQNAVLCFEEVIQKVFPTPDEVIDLNVDANKLADKILKNAEKTHSGFILDAKMPRRENVQARAFLHNLCLNAYDFLRTDTEYLIDLQPFLVRATKEQLSGFQTRTEDNLKKILAAQTSQSESLENLPEKFFDLLQKTGLIERAATAGLAEDVMLKLARLISSDIEFFRDAERVLEGVVMSHLRTQERNEEAIRIMRKLQYEEVAELVSQGKLEFAEALAREYHMTPSFATSERNPPVL